MASQAASGSGGGDRPVGFCNICGGKVHAFQACPSSTTPLCFYCGSSGHFVSQCRGVPPALKCHTCGGVGHFKSVCTSRGQGGGSILTVHKVFTGSHCHMCGGAGHYLTWCSSWSNTGNPLCFKCGSEGHTESQCFNQSVAPKCPKCQGVGHIEKVCSNIAYYVVMKCHKCGEVGHVDRDCPKKTAEEYPAWKGYNACATCGKEGHFTGGCKEYIAR